MPGWLTPALAFLACAALLALLGAVWWAGREYRRRQPPRRLSVLSTRRTR